MVQVIKTDQLMTVYHDDTSAYFASLLPWQKQAWAQVVGQFHQQQLPHGLLASGMEGIGKRAFVWRFVAWLLCQDKSDDKACGLCQSCLWLKAGTHPDLLVLPTSSMLGADTEPDGIKIDDIRNLQTYSHTKGHGVRLMVLDNADTLTLGAANALLKTLEEPRDGVHLMLISDNPARLLLTIKSRVQNLPLNQIHHQQALEYLCQQLPNLQQSLAPMLLGLADGAPLMALSLLDGAWFDKRVLWLKTLSALRTGTRLPIAASDYWQDVLSLTDFVALTRLMLLDVFRVYLDLPSLHTDIDVKQLLKDTQPPSLEAIETFLAKLDDVTLAVHQNVQEKMVYDMLMVDLARL